MPLTRVQPKTITLTSTGNQDNVDIGNAEVVYLNNASLLTLRGLANGQFDGQIVEFISLGAGEVDFAHQNTNSLANNRFINYCTSNVTPLAAGVGTARFRYDMATLRWRLVYHEQGAPIAYTPVWSGGSPAIGNGTLVGSYVLRGRQVSFNVRMNAGSTTTYGSGGVPYSWTLPDKFPADTSTAQYTFAVWALDGGVAHHSFTGANSGTTAIAVFNDGNAGSGITSTSPMTWSNGDTIGITGHYFTT